MSNNCGPEHPEDSMVLNNCDPHHHHHSLPQGGDETKTLLVVAHRAQVQQFPVFIP
eukprot:TRINITY_DN7005_c0_g1_i1.p3 TRINITY_DN7005_c0_g1~~TRINITY_DN7005_c0_g1_i1.p3  ORF type:complete len:56 (-),score=9.89 TRINITY_DN7005_c0_g1_i1:78-245(-)